MPSEITFGELHEVIQAAMGWQDEHLHCFNHQGRKIASIYEEHEAYDEDETELWLRADQDESQRLSVSIQ